mgnify:CR=1 FL=1|tara:strand:- start:138 stop:506 length:369 start_codon:yes stop_codon:yes gene_type:complete
MIRVFYDGKCGLCSREINHYKKICNSNNFTWIDITIESKALSKFGVSQSQGLMYLHATLDNEKIFVGIDAFLLIWRNLPRWKFLAFFIGLPLIKKVCSVIYKNFAKRRYNSYNHCKLSETKI